MSLASGIETSGGISTPTFTNISDSSTVTPTPGEDDELEFTLVVAGIPSLRVLCRVRATPTFGNKEAYEMIHAEGVKLVRPQAVDRSIVALDSSIPGYEVYGTEALLLDQIKRHKPTGLPSFRHRQW